MDALHACRRPHRRAFLLGGLGGLVALARPLGARGVAEPERALVLIQLSGGEATAAAIPGSKLIKIPGMGHDLPAQLWPQFIDAIVENAERAGAPAGAAGS